MVDDVIALSISPWPIPEATMSLVKRAKAELALDYQVIPVKAVAGCPGRVLAFGGPPEPICDSAIVLDPTNYQSVLAALRWVLCDEPLERGFTVLDQLCAIMGTDVKEVFGDDEPTRVVEFK